MIGRYFFQFVVMWLGFVSFTFAQKSEYYLMLGAVQPFTKLTNGTTSLTGHAFVGYGLNTSTGRDSMIRFFGFGKAEDKKISWKQFFTTFSIEGGISNGDSIYAYTQKAKMIRVNITAEQLQKVLEIEQKWKQKAKYQLIASDCVAFANEIAAQALVFQVPQRNWFKHPFPIQYLQALNGMNAIQKENIDGSTLYQLHKTTQNHQLLTAETVIQMP